MGCKYCGALIIHADWCRQVNEAVKEAYEFAEGITLGIDRRFLEDIKVAV